MAGVPNDEQFVGFSPGVDMTEKSSTQTNDKRTIYTYSELFGEGEMALETATSGTMFAGVAKLPQSYDLGGVKYDSYNLKAWAELRPQNTVHVIAIGSINVGAGEIFVIKNRSNIEAVDFNGFGGYTNNPLNLGAMVDDNTDVAGQLNGLFYINQDNMPPAPIEENAMYIVATNSWDFECDAYVDIDFICNQGTTVDFIIA